MYEFVRKQLLVIFHFPYTFATFYILTWTHTYIQTHIDTKCRTEWCEKGRIHNILSIFGINIIFSIFYSTYNLLIALTTPQAYLIICMYVSMYSIHAYIHTHTHAYTVVFVFVCPQTHFNLNSVSVSTAFVCYLASSSNFHSNSTLLTTAGGPLF